MSEDRSLSALNASESVKENEKKSKDTGLIKNEDYDPGEVLKKTTMPDLIKVNKIREIRQENRDEDKILRDIGFLLDSEKYHYELKKLLVRLIIIIFNMKVFKIKDKLLSIREYIDIIRSHLSDIIYNHKTS